MKKLIKKALEDNGFTLRPHMCGVKFDNALNAEKDGVKYYVLTEGGIGKVYIETTLDKVLGLEVE
jgi:hypothetical protein